MTIVAFAGRAGSGKSTAAAALLRHGFRSANFADPLKAMLRAFYREIGLDDEQIERRIEGDLKEAPDPLLCGRTPRYAMQTLGTEWGRGLMAENFWVGAWSQKVGHLGGELVVAADCRFDNEALAVRNLGGEVVGIVGRGKDVGNHASEMGVTTNFDVDNSRSLDEFEAAILYIFESDLCT